MPDLHDGGIDPNTDDGFTAALAAQVAGGETTPSEPAEPVAEESAPTQPRNDLGQFAELAAQPDPVAAPEGAAPSEPAKEAADPVAEFLARHDNDPTAALEAALREKQEAQSLIGRQGNELGELRKVQEQVAKLEGRLEATPPQPLPSVPVGGDNDAIEEMVQTQGGPAALGWVIENRPDLIEPTFDAWASWSADDPAEIARVVAVRARYEANVAIAQANQGQQQPDDRVESLLRERQLSDGIAHLKASRQDWEAIKDHIGPAFEDATTSDRIKALVVSSDRDEQRDGLSILAEIARARALAAATGTAVAERTAQVQATKLAAQVATGSQRPVPEGQPADQRSDAVKAFQERMMAPDTTSILEGLTSSKTA